MKWISATDLQKWGARLEARSILIEIVGDLIRASNTSLTHFRFPSGDKGQVRGFDGDLESQEQTTFVPKGQSKWEFGVSPGSGKAQSDFDKRDAETPTEIKKTNTLVLVNLNTWDHPTLKLPDWILSLKQKSEWADIKYIDGSQLESWLDEHPAVAAMYAKNILGTHPPGVLSIEEYWNSYSTAFSPNLLPEVLLCERESQINQLLECFTGQPQLILLGTEAPEDVLAFAVAAIKNAPTDISLFLQARTLIVETKEAARFLSSKKDLVLLLRPEISDEAGLLSRTAPTLAAATGPQANRSLFRLTRPSAHKMGEALSKMGYEPDHAYGLAKRCGRSITILRRLIPNGPIVPPEWKSSSKVLLPAMFAGGWSTNSELDKEIIQDLSTIPKYEDFERDLRPTLAMKDPPIDNADDVWVMRSQTDAFPHFQHLIGKPELDLLKNSAIKVLGSKIEKPDPNEPFKLNYTPPKNYSSWLRSGIANTLLHLATLAENEGFKVPNSTNQQFVNDIVEGLPGWGTSHQSIDAVAQQLTTIAEAAPNSFLKALESLLEGDSREAKALFTDTDTSLFASTSTHTYVLWSLELLAWDPKYLHRSCLILLKLSGIDPGGTTSNRPIKSLRSILLSWSPNTYATLKERLACLDLLIDSNPDEGWKLLVSLLPKSHDNTSRSSTPKMRDVVPRNPEVLTYAHVWQTQSHIVNKCLQYCGNNEDRILIIIEHLSHFSPEDQNKSLKVIEEFLDKNNKYEGTKAWFALRDEIKRHEYFHTAEWALKPEELIQYKSVLEKYFPKDPLIEYIWLFDDWMPNIGVFEEFDEVDIDQARGEALEKVFKAYGFDGLLNLIGRVKLPHLIMNAVEKCEFDLEFHKSFLIHLSKEEIPKLDLIAMLSGYSSRVFGKEWNDFVFKYNIDEKLEENFLVNLIINWPNTMETWKIVESLGNSIVEKYWLRLSGLPREGSNEDFNFAIEMFLKYKIPLRAIYTLFFRIANAKSSLLINLLKDGIVEINEHPERINNMFSYYLQKILDDMRKRDDIKLEEIARIEFSYIKLLERDSKALIIHDFMAKDPNFYMELIANAFKANNEEKQTITDEERNKASASYDLLSTFTKSPGQTNNDIDHKILLEWVSSVRDLAIKNNRPEITDQYIGHLFAHSPIDDSDGLWPHKSVRKIIELMKSNHIERGVVSERFNMRGVYSKALYAGGAQEREIAERYKHWASNMPNYPQTAALLYKLADDWFANAKDADLRVEKEKMKE
jgi:hypothetical protein